jgi:hypothetical protein
MILVIFSHDILFTKFFSLASSFIIIFAFDSFSETLSVLI